jgi:DNA-directed RNA polymerase subunit F
MTEYTNKSEMVENELFEIAAELTALGDMIPGLFQDIEEMEPETPGGIKILLADMRKRVDDLLKYIGGNFRHFETGKGV